MTGQLKGSAAQEEGSQTKGLQLEAPGALLTSNQKKKRRQKLSKLSKRAALPQACFPLEARCYSALLTLRLLILD
jgi:hypothetical protein